MPNSTKEPKVDAEVISCFATDETKRVKLGDTPFWVEVKRHLDAGEESDVSAAMFDGVSPDALTAAAAEGKKVYLSLSKQKFLKLATFVSDWNLRDGDGKTVRLPSGLAERVAVMRKLSIKMAALIQTAVDEIAADEIKAIDADGDDDLDPTPGGNGIGNP